MRSRLSRSCAAAAAAGAALLLGTARLSNAGLAIYYDFEEGSGAVAQDRSGHGRDGALTNGPGYVTGGALPAGLGSSTAGTALNFDGTDDFVGTSLTAAQLNIQGANPRTVSAWVYTEAFNNGGIFDIGSYANDQNFSLRTLGPNANTWRVQIWGGSDYDFNTVTTGGRNVPTLDNWVHFAQVFDGSVSRTYLNGTQIAFEDNALNTPAAGTSPFRVGRWRDDEFDGLIDDLALYDEALTPAQVQALAGGTSPLAVPEPASAGVFAAAAGAAALARRRRRA